jgi:hypothetical protein
MAYAILRARKMKTAGQMAGMQRHNDRTNNVRNADSDLEHLNQNMSLYDTDSIFEDVEKHIEENEVKVKSNSVKCIEFLLTASPEFFPMEKYQKEDGNYGLRGEGNGRWMNFKKRALDFLDEEFGEGNTVNFSCHLDEKTPHIHAYVVPVVKKERKWKNKSKNGVIREGISTSVGLAAADYLGDKQKLRDLQTRFAHKMSDIGLKRGKEGSLASHENIQKYYDRVNKAHEFEMQTKKFEPNTQELIIPEYKSSLIGGESTKEYRDRVQEMVNFALKEVSKNSAKQITEQFSEEFHRLLEQDKIDKRLREEIKNTKEEARVLIDKSMRLADKWEHEHVMTNQKLTETSERLQKREKNFKALASLTADMKAGNLEAEATVMEFLRKNGYLKNQGKSR